MEGLFRGEVLLDIEGKGVIDIRLALETGNWPWISGGGGRKCKKICTIEQGEKNNLHIQQWQRRCMSKQKNCFC